MKKPIKALWICGWYPSRVTEWSGNFVKRQAEAAFQYADIALLHAVGDPSVKKGYEITSSFDPFFSVIIYYPVTKNPIVKTVRLFKAYSKGYAFARQQWGEADIVHLQVLYPAGIFAWFLYFFKKLPFVITEHRGGYIHKEGSYRGFFMKMFTKLTIRKAAAVFAISDYFAASMKAHGLVNRNYVVVPNVVNTQLFAPTEAKPKAAVFRFLHVSMFDDRIKNISGILRSVAQLAEKRQDFVFNIIGEGYDSQTLMSFAATLNILNRFVFFEGLKKHDAVARAMGEASDAFVMFSNMESQSCVILEAMACGLPIIATETGGINERVTDETGFLLYIGDEAGLVAAMNDMIDQKDRFDPSVIRQKIVEKCSVEAVGQAITGVYEAVLTKSLH